MKDSLGASVTIIGLITAITTAERLLFQLPGGILADRYGRKKIIVYGTLIRTLSPLIYFFTPSWEWILPAALINGMASLYMPAFSAIIADSLPEQRRGAGYGAYNTITNLPMMLGPLIGGVAIESYGYETGIKLFVGLQVITGIIMVVVRQMILKETIESKDKVERRSLIPTTKMYHELPDTIKVMIIVAIIGSFSSRLIFDLINLYALEVLMLSPSQLGLINTAVGATSTILALPGGMLSDRYGRKNNIMLGRTVSPISQGLVTLTSGFNGYFAVRIFNAAGIAIGGSGMEAGGPSWNALIADIVPPGKRATVLGTIGTLTAVVAAPGSVLGGWLWDNLAPQAPFQLSMVTGLVSATLFWLKVKESRMHPITIAVKPEDDH
ncbi:MFS transporter [Candidatus Bathyarchaeota archaeon]|nr:MFS transporter [Candidatus Bathyarchaeota archaeon]